jgi:hypothetical protein
MFPTLAQIATVSEERLHQLGWVSRNSRPAQLTKHAPLNWNAPPTDRNAPRDHFAQGYRAPRIVKLCREALALGGERWLRTLGGTECR